MRSPDLRRGKKSVEVELRMTTVAKYRQRASECDGISKTTIAIFFIVLIFASLLSVFDFAPAFAQGHSVESAGERPVFKKRKLKIGDHLITVEIADTDDRRAYGLMFRQSLAKDNGMLFVFEDEEKRSFWMKNTLIPLSIAYFGADHALNEIIDMQPAVMGATRPKTYPSRTKAKYALEMDLGWFEKRKIRPGVRFKFADN